MKVEGIQGRYYTVAHGDGYSRERAIVVVGRGRGTAEVARPSVLHAAECAARRARLRSVCRRPVPRVLRAGHGPTELGAWRYFRLLLVGYFEGIDSERGIAWRATDSWRCAAFCGSAWRTPRPIIRRSRGRGGSMSRRFDLPDDSSTALPWRSRIVDFDAVVCVDQPARSAKVTSSDVAPDMAAGRRPRRHDEASKTRSGTARRHRWTAESQQPDDGGPRRGRYPVWTEAGWCIRTAGSWRSRRGDRGYLLRRTMITASHRIWLDGVRMVGCVRIFFVPDMEAQIADLVIRAGTRRGDRGYLLRRTKSGSTAYVGCVRISTRHSIHWTGLPRQTRSASYSPTRAFGRSRSSPRRDIRFYAHPRTSGPSHWAAACDGRSNRWAPRQRAVSSKTFSTNCPRGVSIAWTPTSSMQLHGKDRLGLTLACSGQSPVAGKAER